MSSTVLAHMKIAIDEARAASKRGEVPVGAVLVAADGAILASDGNRMVEHNDPTAHAEILVIRKACANLQTERLPDTHLYVTLEPCTMCAAAISFARIKRLYYGAYDPKGGAVDSGVCFFHQPTCHHKPDVYGGFAEQECGALLKEFFQDLRS